GTGSGILAHSALKQKALVTAVDINPDGLKQTQQDGITVIYSNLFENVYESFDYIVCNSPYLPADHREPESDPALVGGKQGYEWCIRFLEQAHHHLNNNGRIFLLCSSLSKPDIILSYAQRYYTNKL